MENVFEILKDLPKPGDYVLLTVAKGSAAGEKAITERLHSTSGGKRFTCPGFRSMIERLQRGAI